MHRIASEVPGLVSVIGGKLTGYRAIAEEVVDAVERRLGVDTEPTTGRVKLPGGGAERSGDPYLDAIYGSRAQRVRELARAEPGLGQPLGPGLPDLAAQVALAARREWCARVEDFMLRRSYLGFRPDRGASVLQGVAAVLGAELGWPADRADEEAQQYRERPNGVRAPVVA
jgi:glycerol-3-phosphate dehydrogenase